jgi:hypothetical protein
MECKIHLNYFKQLISFPLNKIHGNLIPLPQQMPMSFLKENYSQTPIAGILIRVLLNVMIDGVDSLKKSVCSRARPDTTLVEYITLPATIQISL